MLETRNKERIDSLQRIDYIDSKMLIVLGDKYTIDIFLILKEIEEDFAIGTN